LSDIAHIGIAVTDLDKAIKIYSDIFGYPPGEIEEVPDQKVKVAIFHTPEDPFSGGIELLFPTDKGSPIKKFLDKRGEGIHHLALRVENLDQKLRELKALGYQLIDEKPRVGAGGKKIAFLHPGSTGSVLLELQEK